MVAKAIQPEIKKATLEEYFEYEFHSDTKHEFINGQIVPMPYTSDNHGLITANLIRHIANLLADSGFRIYPSDRMVISPSCNEIYYPDIVVVKGQPEFHVHKGKMKATLNPCVLIEVLSDSTEAKDRDDKWPCYREIKSLEQYFLVSQHQSSIECFTRIGKSNDWRYAYSVGLDTTMTVAGKEISLSEIYAQVDWMEKVK